MLVLQADSFNRSRLQTVVVFSLTTNLRLAAAPGNVVCRPRGLPASSVVNVTQISTLAPAARDRDAQLFVGPALTL